MEFEKNDLGNRCYFAFSELFVILMHIKIMRAYIDGVLRFGIPPRFYLLPWCIQAGYELREEKMLLTKP